jgi:hypothetical protein
MWVRGWQYSGQFTHAIFPSISRKVFVQKIQLSIASIGREGGQGLPRRRQRAAMHTPDETVCLRATRIRNVCASSTFIKETGTPVDHKL